MKKNVFRIICAVLLLIFAVGCSQTAETENFDADLITNTDYNSFLGYNFILRDHDHGGTYDIIPVYGENRLDDMMLERYKNFEKEYECTITLLEGDSDGLITNIASSQEKYADIMYDKINRAFGAIKVGAYLNLFDIDNLDVMSGQFGSQSLLESMTWNGELYVMYPQTWANHFAHALLYVQDTLDSVSIANPHEYDEQDKWNWDTFEEISKQYYDTKTENREIIAVNAIVTDCCIYSNGVTWTKVDNNGKRVIAYDNTQTIDALEWLKHMYQSGYMKSSSDWEANAKALIAGETAFYANYSWMGISKDGGYIPTNLDRAFSWISFPQGPSGNGASGVLTFTNPFFLVSSETDIDIIGEFCTKIFAKLGNDDSDWMDTFERENFFDDESFEYYKKMLDTLAFDYSVFIGKTDNVDGAFMNVITGSSSAQEKIDEIKTKTQETLDSYFD